MRKAIQAARAAFSALVRAASDFALSRAARRLAISSLTAAHSRRSGAMTTGSMIFMMVAASV
ncbi:MAG: hypothetical protein HQL39_17255 [Alphaproteobacteria bacterium]|nr:hypothetical protein [Alphaproteobacteria bacterium]MBF0375151.1 hypothetical protein [Alphaproteobacteria bacterium]